MIMPYKISNVFTKPFDSECEAQLAPDCDRQVLQGEQVAFVDDELACNPCMTYAREHNAADQQSRASRIKFRSAGRE